VKMKSVPIFANFLPTALHIFLFQLGTLNSKQPHRASVAVSSAFKRLLAVKKIISSARPLLRDHFAFFRNPKLENFRRGSFHNLRASSRKQNAIMRVVPIFAQFVRSIHPSISPVPAAAVGSKTKFRFLPASYHGCGAIPRAAKPLGQWSFWMLEPRNSVANRVQKAKNRSIFVRIWGVFGATDPFPCS
jgi:hypothetical protein